MEGVLTAAAHCTVNSFSVCVTPLQTHRYGDSVKGDSIFGSRVTGMYPTCKSRNFNKQLEILGIDEKMMLKWALKITSEVVYFVSG